MKLFFLLALLAIPQLYYSQANTEIFLFDINQNNDILQLSNFKNITNNEGYDNQPSFLDDSTVLYARTRDGQTDIAKYTINDQLSTWVNSSEGSEYSPLKIPNQNVVSAIRLDKDGTQVLRKYSLANGDSDVLIDEIIIGYQVWFKEDMLVSSVLEEDYLSLYSSHLKENLNVRLQKKVGRSLHNIPNSNLVSYISKENDEKWEIKSIDPVSGDIQFIKETLPKTEDMCWLTDGSIVMASDGVLYTFKPNEDENWIKVISLTDYGITNITRLAVSPDNSKLAIVGELITN
jgi:hypothetical protein